MIVVVAAVAVGGVGAAMTIVVAWQRQRRTSRRLELLYGLTRQLGQGDDLLVQVSCALADLRRVLRAGRVEVDLPDRGRQHRVTLARTQARPRSSEGGWGAAWDGLPPGASLVDRVPAPELRRELQDRLGPAGAIAPVGSGDATIGSVAIGHPVGRRRFGREDLRLLDALARQLAVLADNRRLNDLLLHDAAHDALTGLPNRSRFTDLLVGLPQPSAVLLVDLDRFKEVNDTLGHPQGDRLLVQAARRIAHEVGARGIVARLGGDEFGILLPRCGAAGAGAVATTVLQSLREPFVIAGVCLETTASIGVTLRGPRPADPDRLLAEAEVAMYAAKASGRGWERYAPDRDPHSRERLMLVSELRSALDGDELELYYQPKVDLRDGRVCGLEALVRWRHPRRGLLGPDEFIPLAESAGLIRPLTLWVLDTAVAQQGELRRSGHDLEIAINLSLRSMVDLDFPDHVSRILRRHGVSPKALTLEITESSVMAEPGRTIGILVRLAELGATISVDDFGTGYSSLSHLKRLPAAELKIDRSFVAGMLDAPRDAAIVASTIDLARNLGLRAVAEGVEDPATWAALAELGCDCAQGFYVSRPMPAARMRRWLSDHQQGAQPGNPAASSRRSRRLRLVDVSQVPAAPAPGTSA